MTDEINALIAKTRARLDVARTQERDGECVSARHHAYDSIDYIASALEALAARVRALEPGAGREVPAPCTCGSKTLLGREHVLIAPDGTHRRNGPCEPRVAVVPAESPAGAVDGEREPRGECACEPCSRVAQRDGYCFECFWDGSGQNNAGCPKCSRAPSPAAEPSAGGERAPYRAERIDCNCDSPDDTCEHFARVVGPDNPIASCRYANHQMADEYAQAMNIAWSFGRDTARADLTALRARLTACDAQVGQHLDALCEALGAVNAAGEPKALPWERVIEEAAALRAKWEASEATVRALRERERVLIDCAHAADSALMGSRLAGDSARIFDARAALEPVRLWSYPVAPEQAPRKEGEA